MSDERLKHIYEDQRKELEFRRTRKQQIFTWSATVQLAITGGILVSSAKGSILASLGESGKFWASVMILAFTAYSVLWQLRQRKLMRAQQQVLAKLAQRRGWFDEMGPDGVTPLLPDGWKQWGTREQNPLAGSGKVAITALLGFVATAAVWLSTR